MNDLNDILTVLRCFVEHRFCDAEIDIKEVLEEASRHNLLPLIVEVCSDQINRSDPELKGYLYNAMHSIAAQVQRTGEFLRVYKKIAENGYYPLVLKGIICRELYGEYQDFRPSYDEDILIKKEDFEGIRDILIAEGYVPDIDADRFDLKDKIQEVTFCGSNLTIEVHLNLNGENNQLRKKMNSYFLDVFTNKRIQVIQDVAIYTLSHTDHCLFLIIHAFRHFTGGGFGIRQVLDIMLYGQEFSNEIDWEYIRRSLKGLRADKFYSDLVHLSNTYLGFRQEIDTVAVSHR